MVLTEKLAVNTNVGDISGDRIISAKCATQETIAEGRTEDINCILSKILQKVEPIEEMNTKLEHMATDISDIKETVKRHDEELRDLKQVFDHQQEDMQDISERVEKLEKETVNQDHLTLMESALLSENSRLKDRLLKLEEYSRRNNILFHGIQEREGENCYDVIQQFLVKSLQIPDASSYQIGNAHRLGLKRNGKPRPIIVQFISPGQALEIYKKRFCLKSNLNGQSAPQQRQFLSRDLPEEIIRVQNQLRIVLKEAKKIDIDAYIYRDKLIFKKRSYDLAACYQIEELCVEKIGTIYLADAILFHGRFCPLSNFYPSEITVDGKQYSSVEQYYQVQRARYCGHLRLACQMLQTKDPAEIKSLGNQLDKEAWPQDLQAAAMKRALREKFKQKTKLGGLLRDTGKKTLIECNKYDSYWANGRHLYDKNARHGIGQNRLGKLLEEVREMVN